jgi:hypothetical protein
MAITFNRRAMKTKKRASGGGRKPQGPISGNTAWLQARITADLQDRLKHEAAQNGRSVSQEAQLRLKESFDLPAELQKQWGPPHIKDLAQLVSHVVRSVETSASGNPFAENAGEFAWHRNAYTHAAVVAAVNAILANYKPAGAAQVPEAVEKSTEWIERESGKEQAAYQRAPESIGLACARGLLSQVATYSTPPIKMPSGAHYAEGFYVFPNISKNLK